MLFPLYNYNNLCSFNDYINIVNININKNFISDKRDKLSILKYIYRDVDISTLNKNLKIFDEIDKNLVYQVALEIYRLRYITFQYMQFSDDILEYNIKYYGYFKYTNPLDMIHLLKHEIKYMFNLSQEQENFIPFFMSRSNSFLLAGPGSGKTALLAEISSRLASSSNVLVLMYNVSAEYNFRKLLKSKGVTNVNIYTFHKYANNILSKSEVTNINMDKTILIASEHNTDKYDYVLVDEMQDMSSDMLKLVNSISAHRKILAGDLRQSLYPNNDLDQYVKDNKDDIYKLTINFRSTPEIIRFINTFSRAYYDDFYHIEQTSFHNSVNNKNSVRYDRIYNYDHYDNCYVIGLMSYRYHGMKHVHDHVIENNVKIYNSDNTTNYKETIKPDVSYLICTRSVKGLEKHNVYVGGCNLQITDRFSMRDIVNYFFTACSRAKDNLYLIKGACNLFDKFISEYISLQHLDERKIVIEKQEQNKYVKKEIEYIELTDDFISTLSHIKPVYSTKVLRNTNVLEYYTENPINTDDIEYKKHIEKYFGNNNMIKNHEFTLDNIKVSCDLLYCNNTDDDNKEYNIINISYNDKMLEQVLLKSYLTKLLFKNTNVYTLTHNRILTMKHSLNDYNTFKLNLIVRTRNINIFDNFNGTNILINYSCYNNMYICDLYIVVINVNSKDVLATYYKTYNNDNKMLYNVAKTCTTYQSFKDRYGLEPSPINNNIRMVRKDLADILIKYKDFNNIIYFNKCDDMLIDRYKNKYHYINFVNDKDNVINETINFILH